MKLPAQRGTANITVGLLVGIFAHAADCGMIAVSLAIGVKRFAAKKGNRYLIQQEFMVLGEVLLQAATDGENPLARAIVNLHVFSGARKGETETLKWPEVDFASENLKLVDAETEQKIIPLDAGAPADSE